MLRARDRMRDYLILHCSDQDVVDDMVLAIEEACTNAIRHSGSPLDIEIVLAVDGDTLEAVVTDRGRGFDVGAFDPEDEPDVTARGGRGLYMISRLVDEMELRSGDGIEVRMTKRAVAGGRPPSLDSGLGEAVVADASAWRAARVRTMLEEIDEGFVALDWEYRYVHANAAMLALAGLSLGELLGKTPWELWPAFAATPEERAYRDAMEIGRPSALEQRSSLNGDWHETRVYPTASGICVYFREINERKRAEEERERLVDELSRISRRETRTAHAAEILTAVDEILLDALTVDDLTARLVGQASAAAGADKSLVIRVADGAFTITHVRGVCEDLVGKPRTAAFFPDFVLAADQKRPVLIADAWTDERTNKEFVIPHDLHALQLLPLVVEGRVGHVLALAYQEPQAFDDDDRRSAGRMAAAMSLALRNAQLFEAEVASRRLADGELRTTARLLSGASILATATDLQAGVKRVIDTIRETLGGVRAVVYTYDQAQGELQVLASGGGPAPADGSRLPLASLTAAAGRVLAEMKTTLIDFDALPATERGIAERFDVHLLQAVPLAYQERLVGVIVFDDPEAPRRSFARRDVEIVEAFAAQVAAAIDNARLLDAERRRVARLTMLQNLSSLVTSSLDLEAVIAKGLEQVVKLLGVTATSLWILHDGQRLRLRGARGFGEQFFAEFAEGLATDAPHDVAKAVSSGEPVVHEDATESAVSAPVRDAYARYGMALGALVAVPLRSPAGSVGGLTLAWDEPQVFSDDDKAFHLLLADTFAIALDNARLYEAELKRATRSEALHALTNLAVSTFDAEEVARRAFSFITRRLDVQNVHAYTAGKRGGTLDFLAGGGATPAFYAEVGRGIGLDEPLEVVPVFKTAVPIVRGDAGAADVPEAVRDLYTRNGMELGAYLVVPLASGGETLGVLVVAWAEPQRFEEDDLHFYAAIANELAGALRNARLFATAAESGRQVSDILASMTDGFVSVDRDWRYVLVNPAAERMLHMRADELLGRRLPDVFPDIDGLPMYRKAMDEGVPVAFETYAKPTDSWVEVRVYPTEFGLSVFAADISARKLSEKERQRLLEGSLAQATQLADRAAFAETLNAIDRLVHSTLDLDEIMQRALDEGVRALAVDAGAVEMREDAAWIVRYQNGFADADIGLRLSDVEAPVATRVERARELLAIGDLRADGASNVGFVRSYALRSVLAIPLIARDEVIGCLLLYGRHSRTFDAAEIEFGRTVGATVSLALENARLFRAEAQAQRRTERELETTRLLIEAADALKSVSLTEVLSKLTDIVRRVSGHSRVTVNLWREDLELLEVAASAGASPVPLGLCLKLDELTAPARAAAETGEPTLIDYDAIAPGKRGVADEMASHLALDVPLLVQGRLVGLIAVDDPGLRREFSERETRLVEGIAAQAATAIANADLFEHEREAARFGETLAVVDSLVHSSLDFDQIVQIALREGAAALRAESCGVSLHEDEERRFRVAYVHDMPADKVGILIPDEQDTHGLLAMSSGETQAIHDTGTDPRVVRALMEEWGIKAVICAPLLVRGKAIGVIYFNYHRAPHRFSDFEVDFLRRLAPSVSTALGNARLYEAQRNVAITLQEHFMHPLPSIDGIELAAVSLPAGREELIGGDFHDAVQLPDGRVLAIIGDVMGKGISAAGLTETVRSAVRTAAIISPEPETVLANANRLLLQEDGHRQLTTALLLVIDPLSGRGSMASAGHPPPVHISDAGCRMLEMENALPLGAMEQSFAVSDFTLGPGEALVLYTDGLTDARRDGELFGEDRLLDVLESAGKRYPRYLADRLRDAVTTFADDLRDDLQVLVLRRGA